MTLLSLQTHLPHPKEIAQKLDEANSVDEPTTTHLIQSIYQATLDPLVVLSARRHDPQIAQCASRLKLSGAGLFEISVPLDVVFDSDREGSRLLTAVHFEILGRDACVGGVSHGQKYLFISYNTGSCTEQEFKNLASEAENTERLHDQQRAQAIRALLGSDELMNLVQESWKGLVERQTDGETGGDLVPDLIQILFDFLPALRAARQTYCIPLAETSAEAETMAEGKADVTTAASSVGPSSGSHESKLDAQQA